MKGVGHDMGAEGEEVGADLAGCGGQGVEVIEIESRGDDFDNPGSISGESIVTRK